MPRSGDVFGIGTFSNLSIPQIFILSLRRGNTLEHSTLSLVVQTKAIKKNDVSFFVIATAQQ
jgi:hypothetical protein